MKVKVIVEVSSCKECPHCKWTGLLSGRKDFICKETGNGISGEHYDSKRIAKWCPFIDKQQK